MFVVTSFSSFRRSTCQTISRPAQIWPDLFRFERSFKNAVRKFSPVIRTFAGLQFLRKQFFRTWPADGGHRFDLKVVRNPQFFAGAIVIEAFHPMHDETLVKALQCEIFPRCSTII